MSQLLQEALGVSEDSLSQSALGALQKTTTVVTEIDEGYLLMDHYGEKGVRKTMEDEYIICDSLRKLVPQLPEECDFTVCGLFDGHGGRKTAKFAKDHLLSEIGSQIANMIEDNKRLNEEKSFDFIFKKSVNIACWRLDSRIANEIPGCNDGCTALLLFFGGKRLFAVNLGDSAAYLCRCIDNVAHSIPLNDVHKAWSQHEKERILHYGGTVECGRVNGILEVTRSFGDLQLKKFGVLCVGTFKQAKLDFGQDAFVLMACDGFWSVMDANEACHRTLSLIKKEKSRASSCPHMPFVETKKICKELVEYALTAKRSQDNVSVILIRFAKK